MLWHNGDALPPDISCQVPAVVSENAGCDRFGFTGIPRDTDEQLEEKTHPQTPWHSMYQLCLPSFVVHFYGKCVGTYLDGPGS